MDALARTFENAAHWLEVEADFLASHHQLSEASAMRKHACSLREKAARCHQHSVALKRHGAQECLLPAIPTSPRQWLSGLLRVGPNPQHESPSNPS